MHTALNLASLPTPFLNNLPSSVHIGLTHSFHDCRLSGVCMHCNLLNQFPTDTCVTYDSVISNKAAMYFLTMGHLTKGYVHLQFGQTLFSEVVSQQCKRGTLHQV